MRAVKIIAGNPETGVENRAEVVDIADRLESYQAIVDGYIEAVYLQRPDAPEVVVYLNEEGKLQDLPVNWLATHMSRAFHAIPMDDAIMGDVVLVGNGQDGENAPVPDWALSAVEGMTA